LKIQYNTIQWWLIPSVSPPRGNIGDGPNTSPDSRGAWTGGQNRRSKSRSQSGERKRKLRGEEGKEVGLEVPAKGGERRDGRGGSESRR